MAAKSISALGSHNALLERIFSHWLSSKAKQEAFHALLEFFPVQIFDENEIAKAYEDVTRAFNQELVQFAIKANPTIMPILKRLGCKFEVASVGEIGLCQQLGIPTAGLLYTNPSRSWLENKFAVKAGIRRFVCHNQDGLDSLKEGIRLAQEDSTKLQLQKCDSGYVDPDFTPEIIIRLQVIQRHKIDKTGKGITRLRFGTTKEDAAKLLILCHKPESEGGYGFNATGTSFHVGSDEKNPEVWRCPIEDSAYVFKQFYDQTGAKLREVDIGGGMPFQRRKVKTHDTFAKAIRSYFETYFVEDNGLDLPYVSLEPGRALSSSAGVLFSRVIDASLRQVSKKKTGRMEPLNVITENAGRINGGVVPFGYDAYAFTFDLQKGFIDCPGRKKLHSKTFGETCTDFDDSGEFELPASVKRGDNLVFLGTGVYVDAFKSELCSLQPPLVIRVEEGLPFPEFKDLAFHVKSHLTALQSKHPLLGNDIENILVKFRKAMG